MPELRPGAAKEINIFLKKHSFGFLQVVVIVLLVSVNEKLRDDRKLQGIQ